MAVPKKRNTPTSRRDRRSHHRLSAVAVTTCPNCKAPALPHRVCSNCGFYKGRSYVSRAIEAEFKSVKKAAKPKAASKKKSA